MISRLLSYFQNCGKKIFSRATLSRGFPHFRAWWRSPNCPGRIIIINNLVWGPVPLFVPWKHCSQCGLFYDSPFSKRSYFARQVSLASTTRGSPLAARGGTMGEKWWPNVAWDMHPGFFNMPQIWDMGPIILLPFRRKACWGFLYPFKNPTRYLGYQRPARYLCTTEAASREAKF